MCNPKVMCVRSSFVEPVIAPMSGAKTDIVGSMHQKDKKWRDVGVFCDVFEFENGKTKQLTSYLMPNKNI